MSNSLVTSGSAASSTVSSSDGHLVKPPVEQEEKKKQVDGKWMRARESIGPGVINGVTGMTIQLVLAGNGCRRRKGHCHTLVRNESGRAEGRVQVCRCSCEEPTCERMDEWHRQPVRGHGDPWEREKTTWPPPSGHRGSQEGGIDKDKR